MCRCAISPRCSALATQRSRADDQVVPVEDLIVESYLLVVKSLTKKLRTQLGLLADDPVPRRKETA